MEKQLEPKAVIVIFGATGDLAMRKLFPSIYNLYCNGQIDENVAVVGAARKPWDNETFREHVKKSLMNKVDSEEEIPDSFLSRFFYESVDVTEPSSYQNLQHLITTLEETYETDGNRMFYLAMAPEFFGTIAQNLQAYGLKDGQGWTRLVIEKPFGHDLPSAQKLNNQVREAFDEEQIYRIDHYLGKEMVQNIEVIRFANGIFGHLWNNQYISNIQITSSESLGVEERFHFYNQSGAVRDMVQNHMLQMLALLAMEPPIKLETDEVRSEKIKVFRAMRPIKPEKVDQYFIRGQYGAGEIDGNPVKSYREEHEALESSNTETFVAGKILIDNYRWAGVPFYIRTGKRMAEKAAKIVVEFKNMPMNLYYDEKDYQQPNLLVINVQPEEGVTLHLNAKSNQPGIQAEPIKLSYSYNCKERISAPEAYEKLLLDCMLGDATNFTHWDEVALSWKFIDSIIEGWKMQKPDFPNYKAGSKGPEAANQLLEKDGFHWWPIKDI